MNKGELILALEGLMDETEIIVRAFNSSTTRFVIDAHYTRPRGDEDACMCLVIDSYPSTSEGVK
jgi:hypothetical protein